MSYVFSALQPTSNQNNKVVKNATKSSNIRQNYYMRHSENGVNRNHVVSNGTIYSTGEGLYTGRASFLDQTYGLRRQDEARNVLHNGVYR